MEYFKYTDKINLQPGTTAAQVVKLVGHGKKVLEIGCAAGRMSEVLAVHQNCVVTGVELVQSAAAFAKKYCQRVICGNVEELDLAAELAGEFFDVITFSDVLEHLKHPGLVLKKVRTLLTPEGYIVASLPNVTHLSVVLEMLQGRFLYQRLGLLDENHLRFFSSAGVQALFTGAGYKITFQGRVLLPPEFTEFQTDMASFPPPVIEYAMAANPDYNTYHFVAKAVQAPAGEQDTAKNTPELSLEGAGREVSWGNRLLFQLTERLREKEKEIARLKKIIAGLPE